MIKYFMLIVLFQSFILTVQSEYSMVNIICTIAILIAFIVIFLIKRE